MAQASKSKTKEASLPRGDLVWRGLREGGMFVLLAVALFLMVALVGYQPDDPAWSYSGSKGVATNAGGMLGAWFADITLYLFGYMAFLFPLIVAYAAVALHRGQLGPGAPVQPGRTAVRSLGFLLTLGTGCSLAAVHFLHPLLPMPAGAGGILGAVLGEPLAEGMGLLGATLILLALFFTGVTLFTGLSWLWLMDETGRLTLALLGALQTRLQALREHYAGRQARREREQKVQVQIQRKAKRSPPRIEPTVKPVEPSERAERERQVPLFDAKSGDLPPLALLEEARKSGKGFSKEVLQAMSQQVELKLKDFNIDVVVEEVNPGPVITRFELQLAPGVKVAQISNLSKDLARALSVVAVRVVEVIPGKSTVGLEIPNETREIVSLSEILGSRAYDHSASPLTLALGKDIGGQPMVADLAKMPHLLVAGTTGSGKSVAINAMLLSLLYKAGPDQVRLIMVDPKMLELSVYDGIPHLLAPVVTDMKEAANALKWSVFEMDRRYRLMAALGVRNIAGYNKKVKEARAAGTPLKDPLFKPSDTLEGEAPELETLPYIVVVVDELADMMMIVGKKVEELIARLAQKARAAGIHLILATQRPSVDVITGLIKANIPTRIAFQVSSRIDSRTILDQMGAEHLLGHGDMLYLNAGSAHPTRVHGAFVDDHEVHGVVAHLKQQGEPNYIEEITNGGSDVTVDGMAGEGADSEDDPLYDEAVAIVTETRKASVSGVQRRLRIGYNRAARLVEQMELSGVVSALQSNGQREVLAPPPPKD